MYHLNKTRTKKKLCNKDCNKRKNVLKVKGNFVNIRQSDNLKIRSTYRLRFGGKLSPIMTTIDYDF